MAFAIPLALLLLAADLETRPVWTGPGVSLLGAPAFDGSFLSVVEPGSRNIARRALRKDAAVEPVGGAKVSEEFAYFSVPSHDGKRIAYAWFNRDRFYELRVTDDAGGHKVVYRNEEAGFVQPTAWSPDGRQVLTLLFRRDNTSQITLIDVETGRARVLRSLAWVYPKKMDLSPDGRWIVYDSFPDAKPGPREIYLLAADGSEERRLTEHPADDLFPMFSPDGREILFASDRSGLLDLYVMPLDGKGAPRLVMKSAGRYLPLGVTRDGRVYYGRRMGSGTRIEVEGRNTGQLAVVTPRGASENHGLEATVLMAKDGAGDWRPWDLPLAHVEKARWSPDGRRLLISGTDGKGRAGLFLAEAGAATVRPLVVDEYASAKGVEGVWLDASRVAFAVKGSVRERHLESGEEKELAALEAVALAGGTRGLAVATASEVVELASGRRWPVRGIEQVEWWGRRLVVTRGAAVAELDEKGAHKVDWPRYAGGAIAMSSDGSALAWAVDDTKQEVWVLEHVWSSAGTAAR